MTDNKSARILKFKKLKNSSWWEIKLIKEHINTREVWIKKTYQEYLNDSKKKNSETFKRTNEWSQVCREYQRGSCRRAEGECRYAHPPEGVAVETSTSPCNVAEAMSGGVTFVAPPPGGCPASGIQSRVAGGTSESSAMVTVCMDAVRGRCSRQPCRYFHPPAHLVPQIQANHLRARSSAATTAATATTVLSSAVLLLQDARLLFLWGFGFWVWFGIFRSLPLFFLSWLCSYASFLIIIFQMLS